MDAARQGQAAQAFTAAVAAVTAWPADTAHWERLSRAYAAIGSTEGAAYAMFFARRVPVLNRLHPRAAAFAAETVGPPDGAGDPEVRRSYGETGVLLADFYRQRFEEGVAERSRREAAEVPVYRPYLAYPAALATLAAGGALLFRFGSELATGGVE